MKKKIGLIFASTLCLLIVFFKAPLTFAQSEAWDSVQVRAYGKNIAVSEDFFETDNATINFTVASPPAGENEAMRALYNNTISVLNEESGENVTTILSPGDEVFIMKGENYQYGKIGTAEPDIETIYYIGNANMLLVNNAVIPEFPSIIILALFMLTTFLAVLVYRRKHTIEQ